MRLSSMREILENTAIDHVYYRSYDPLVRCVGREYTPYRAAQIAMLVGGGRLKWTPDVVQAMYWPLNSRIELVWNLDDSGPAFATDAGEWDRPARADLVEAGAAPDWVKALEANVKASGNLYGLAEQPKAVGQAPVLYIADDTTRAHAPEIAQAMQLLLRAAGCDFTTLAQGTDGWALYDLGLWELAREKATEFAGWIRASGARTVVANCPALVYALREWYPTLGLRLEAEVLHHSEFLLKLGMRGKFAGRVTFHDPSYLSRYLHQVEAPRALLGRVEGLELAECYFKGEKANPSGPLAVFFHEGYAEQIAARRADELALAARIVVTAAPASKRNLARVARARGLQVLDIAEVLAC